MVLHCCNGWLLDDQVLLKKITALDYYSASTLIEVSDAAHLVFSMNLL